MRELCDALIAGLATAFPNIVSGPGKIAQVDHSLVVDGAMSETALATFMQKAADSPGSVVQRMKLTSATGGVAKIGTVVQLRVPPNVGSDRRARVVRRDRRRCSLTMRFVER
jgi:hypothetical protein